MVVVAAGLTGVPHAGAVSVGIFEASAYLDWNENAGGQTLYELSIADLFLTPPRATTNEFAGAGFDTTFTDSTVDGLGEISWVVTNNTGAPVTGVKFFANANLDILDAFFDAFNEEASFQAIGLPGGAPAGAIAFSEWEADDPDLFFGGDIVANLDAGLLDDFNAVGLNSLFDQDVAFALGFNVGTLAPGQQFEARFAITDGAAPNGLAQIDLDSAEIISFNGFVVVAPVQADGLMLLGLAGLAAFRRPPPRVANNALDIQHGKG